MEVRVGWRRGVGAGCQRCVSFVFIVLTSRGEEEGGSTTARLCSHLKLNTSTQSFWVGEGDGDGVCVWVGGTNDGNSQKTQQRSGQHQNHHQGVGGAWHGMALGIAPPLL